MARVPANAQVKLDQITEQRRKIREDRATLRQRIESEFEKQSLADQLKLSRLCNEAVEMGVSKTRMGKALGTSNWETINAVLDLAAGSLEEERAEIAKLPRYTVLQSNGAFVLTFNIDANGKRIVPAKKLTSQRYQGRDWGDASYIYYDLKDFPAKDDDLLNEIESELISELRLSGSMDEVQIKGWSPTPEQQPVYTVPDPSSPEFSKWLGDDDDE